MSVALHYTVDGPASAPVVVLGPSLGTTGEIWQPQVPALAGRYRVVRYDHRGHGRSPVPPGPYHVADLGGDLLALLDTLDAGPVHLAGLSMGGLVAAWVAAHAPQRVRRLVLLGVSPRFGDPRTWADRAATVRAKGVAAIADAALQRWFPPGFAERDPATVDSARRQLISTPAEGYAACCGALATADLTPMLGSITAPTLIVAGTEDPTSPPEHAAALAAGIGGARVEVVAGAAHLINLAAPEQVSRLLLDFLGEEQ